MLTSGLGSTVKTGVGGHYETSDLELCWNSLSTYRDVNQISHHVYWKSMGSVNVTACVVG